MDADAENVLQSLWRRFHPEAQMVCAGCGYVQWRNDITTAPEGWEATTLRDPRSPNSTLTVWWCPSCNGEK